MPFFARQIAAASGRRAQVAVEGIPLQAEQIFIAPGDAHLCLARGGRGVCVSLSRAPASSGCLPSVDNMLWSVSEIYGRNGLGIMFSGMGRDGLVGSARLVRSEEHTSELQSLMRISYAVFCLIKKIHNSLK